MSEQSLATFTATPDERSLADVPDVDSSPEVTPENFDLDGWLAGIRPTRRSVKLHAEGHLIARLEELAERIDAAPEGVDVDELIAEFERVRDQFNTGVWFTVEKRSSEWSKRFRKDLSKRHNLKPDDNEGDNIIATLHQLAEQIVTPTGITYQHLRDMLDANEGELNKLILTMTNANTQLAESAGVLTRDFSERRSDTTQDSSEL